jgi:hypothetical protein
VPRNWSRNRAQQDSYENGAEQKQQHLRKLPDQKDSGPDGRSEHEELGGPPQPCALFRFGPTGHVVLRSSATVACSI